MLFGKKKKEAKNLSFQPYDKGIDLPDFPGYKEDPMPFSARKKFEPFQKKVHESSFLPLEPLQKDFMIPQRKKKLQEMEQFPERKFPEKMEKARQGEKPFFVRMDAYHEVLGIIEALQERLRNIEGVLAELSKLKREEDRELDTWHNDLEKIKEQLLLLDKKLFEP